jgi:hypothetical protein
MPVIVRRRITLEKETEDPHSRLGGSWKSSEKASIQNN